MPKIKLKVKFPAKKVGYTPLVDPYNHQLISVLTYGGQWQPAPGDMPTEVTVYGAKYKIYYHTRIYNAPRKSQRLNGVVLYQNRIIILDPEQPLHQLRETLYHEVGHIYLKVWQTKSEPLYKVTHAQMEDLCDMFGEAICDLARNNRLPTG